MKENKFIRNISYLLLTHVLPSLIKEGNDYPNIHIKFEDHTSNIFFKMAILTFSGVVTTPPPPEDFFLGHQNAKESDQGHLPNRFYILCGHFDEIF